MSEERRELYEKLNELHKVGGEQALRDVHKYASGLLDGCRIMKSAKAAKEKTAEEGKTNG